MKAKVGHIYIEKKREYTSVWHVWVKHIDEDGVHYTSIMFNSITNKYQWTNDTIDMVDVPVSVKWFEDTFEEVSMQEERLIKIMLL